MDSCSSVDVEREIIEGDGSTGGLLDGCYFRDSGNVKRLSVSILVDGSFWLLLEHEPSLILNCFNWHSNRFIIWNSIWCYSCKFSDRGGGGDFCWVNEHHESSTVGVFHSDRYLSWGLRGVSASTFLVLMILLVSCNWFCNCLPAIPPLGITQYTFVWPVCLQTLQVGLFDFCGCGWAARAMNLGRNWLLWLHLIESASWRLCLFSSSARIFSDV